MFIIRPRSWLFAAAAAFGGLLSGCGSASTGESVDTSAVELEASGPGRAVAGWQGKGPSGSGGPGQGTPFESDPECEDGNPCTVDKVAGPHCVHHQMPQHWPCDDGNPCTQADQCLQGACAGTAAPNGTACDDGDACTRTDTCQSAGCVGSDPVECKASDQCHLPGTCDPATGLCDDPMAGDGAWCDDKDLCTKTDACISGVCQGWDPVEPTAPDGCHAAGPCDPATGLFPISTLGDGTSCDDGDPCTSGDTCQSGACVGAPVVCPTPSAHCRLGAVCSPLTGACVDLVAPDGFGCDDGNACTGTDTCQSGACVGSSPTICLPGPCWTAGTCDPATGVCSTPNKPNGTLCDDGNPCTENDKCQGGKCGGANVANGKTCDAQDLCSRCQGGHCKPNAVNCPGAKVCDPQTGSCVSAMVALVPTSVAFTVLYTSCGDGALDLHVNGALVETLRPEPDCDCARGPETIVITDPQVLASINGCDDTFRLGEGTLDEDLAIGFVEVTVAYEDEPPSRACLFDALDEGACAPRDLCEGYEMGLSALSTSELRRPACAGR